MKLKSISLDLAIGFPVEKVEMIDFSETLISKMKEIKELKLSKGKGIVSEFESESFQFLVTPFGIMGRLKSQYPSEIVFIELGRMLNSMTGVITNLNENASSGIDVQVVYEGDFERVITKVVNKREIQVSEKKIRINSFLIDLREKEKECPFTIVVYKDKAEINIRFCVGGPKICEERLCIIPKEVKISEKVQVAKKVVEGLL